MSLPSYLLGKCKGSVEPLSNNGKVLRHLKVVYVVAFLPVGHLDLFGERRVTDGGHAASAELQPRC